MRRGLLLNYIFIGRSIDWLVDWLGLVCWLGLVDWFIGWLIDWLIDWFYLVCLRCWPERWEIKSVCWRPSTGTLYSFIHLTIFSQYSFLETDKILSPYNSLNSCPMIGSCWAHSLSLWQPVPGRYQGGTALLICNPVRFGLQTALCTVVHFGFPFRSTLDLDLNVLRIMSIWHIL